MPVRTTDPARLLAVASIVIMGLTACAGGNGQSAAPADPGDPSNAASPTTTVDPTTTLDPSPSVSTPQPTSDAFGASVFDDPDDCEDDSVGYRVAFPDAWWWNQPFESEIGARAQCRYFAPIEFDASTVNREQPIPEGIAIYALVTPPDGGLGQSGEVVFTEDLTIAGQPANRGEQEHAPGGFLAEGERIYRYVIQLSQDRQLAFTTGNTVGNYDENREVLDGMMQTIELFEPDDLCGPRGDRFVCGEIIVGLADGTAEPIETIVERNGGDPETDLVGVAEEIGVYTITVPHGTEGDEMSRYLTDEAVEYAVPNVAEGELTGDSGAW